MSKEFSKRAEFMSYQRPTADEAEIWFRHTHWARKRERVRAILARAGTGARQLEAFDECGAQCLIEANKETGEFRLRADYCKNRHCEPCNRAKANLLAANLRKRLEEKPDGRYRFITLTLKHNAAPLGDQITRLYASFKKLRNLAWWKSSQKGGCAVLEVKWNAGTKRWHPHLHIIAEGGFVKQSELSARWHQVTGDSQIVDIRMLNSGQDAAHYLCKYVSKGTNDDVWKDDNAAIEWVCAMRGTRSAATYGTWRGYKLLDHPKDHGTWKPIAMLISVVRDARLGEPWAIQMLDTLTRVKQYNPNKTRGKPAEPTP